MTDFKDGFSSQSYYPDSTYYLDQENTPEETPLSEDQISNMGENFEWPNTYWRKNKWQIGNDRLYGCHY